MTRDPESQAKPSEEANRGWLVGWASNKGGEMKFRAINESHQRVYYEAIFEAENEDDAERMVADGMVTWNETRSKIDDDNVTIEEVKDEL